MHSVLFFFFLLSYGVHGFYWDKKNGEKRRQEGIFLCRPRCPGERRGSMQHGGLALGRAVRSELHPGDSGRALLLFASDSWQMALNSIF